MNYLEKNINNFIIDLKELIKFKTYLKNKNDKYPNTEMIKALEYLKSISIRDHLKCYIDKEGFYGYIEIGEGEELIGILTHIDVVPPGKYEDWETKKPFELYKKDGKLFGRGVCDDKGPLMLIYYLLKELKNEKLNRRVRLIFPTDEESSWRGVAKYNRLEEKPSFGFTPDSTFPVTFLEREILQIELSTKGTDFEINSGIAANVVPAEAIYKKDDEEILEKGKSSHAMVPHEGENAAQKLFLKLKDKKLKNQLIDFVNNELNMETNGITLFSKLIKDDYATITVNLGIAKFDKNKSKIIIDMRIPITSSKKEIRELYKNKLSKYKDIKYKEIKSDKSVYIEEDSFIIKDLNDSYEEIIKEKLSPQASGGGTYAKSMDNIVAYGPLFPWSIQTQHQANEQIEIKDYIKSYDIYKNILKKWTK